MRAREAPAVRGPRYRRARYLITYWRGRDFVVHNYATDTKAASSPTLLELLNALDDWHTAETLARYLGDADVSRTRRWLERLHGLTLLDRSDIPPSRVEAALERWDTWTPEAAFFHLATKNPPYTDPKLNEQTLLRKSSVAPPPPPVKRLKRARTLPLPAPSAPAELTAVLTNRRTWRRFGTEPIRADQLGTLLGLTFGVRRWSDVGARGRFALKTAPSGGGRHNLEAYVLVRRVTGIAAGVYHYDPNRHVLRAVRRPAVVPRVSTYVPWQTWYDDAGVLVLMSAVFERAQWRYSHPRSYRSVMFEAGHFCQNFLLLATALELAPFCTGALADAVLERDLGIDGVSESVIYACGVGTRPPGVAWAPWPDTSDTPRLIPPVSTKITRTR